MAILYENTSLLCRAEQPISLYKSPIDKTPTNEILNNGTVFITKRRAIVSDKITLLQISQIDGVDKHVLGKWVNENIVTIMPLNDTDTVFENIEIFNENEYNVSLSIISDKIIIYSNKDSLNPLTCGLKAGNIVYCSDKYHYVNGIRDEIRYKVVAVSDGADTSVIGNWILANVSVKETSDDVYEFVLAELCSARNTTGASSIDMDDFNEMLITNVSYKSTQTGTSTRSRTDNMSLAEKQQIADSIFSEQATVTTTSSDIKRLEQASNYIEDYTERNTATDKELYAAYGVNYEYYMSAAYNSLMKLPVGRMLFVHGMPFQYTAITDRRQNSSNAYSDEGLKANGGPMGVGGQDMYGRVFAKEIVSNTPIVVIVPGEPKFLTSLKVGLFASADANNKVKNSWLPVWMSKDDNEQALKDAMEQGGNYDYFSIEIDTTNYFKYVNSLARTSAKLMGIGDYEYQGIRCKNFDWYNYNRSANQDYSIFEEVTGLDGGISFAYDPQSSVTDSIGNNTQDSQLAGLLTQSSDTVKEIQFLTRGVGVDMVNDDKAEYESALASMNTDGMSGVTSRLSGFLNNTVAGMNVRFPQIWTDSNNSKSYSLDMKFITPYANAFCEWRYVLVPFYHIFALAAPRSDETISAYSAPYLIRAFSKGYFNVEMGIIENITWKRFGDGDMIAENGVPTEIDVTIDFKDLYHSLSMTSFGIKGATGKPGLFYNNTGLMDMVGTMSGVNMNRINIAERMSMYYEASTNVFGSLGSNFIRHFTDRTRNVMDKYLYGM